MAVSKLKLEWKDYTEILCSKNVKIHKMNVVLKLEGGKHQMSYADDTTLRAENANNLQAIKVKRYS